MSEVNFEAIPNALPSPGIVLRLGQSSPKYLRITHVFESRVFVMAVGEPEGARYARRPVMKSLFDLVNVGNDEIRYGRLSLPEMFFEIPDPISDRGLALQAAWDLIEPLVQSFEDEVNLSRTLFTALISHRAVSTNTNFITLRRLLLRYYYFGNLRQSLLPLYRGPKPDSSATKNKLSKNILNPPKRRGRQSIQAAVVGKNDFVVQEDDIADMIKRLKTQLRIGPTYITSIYEKYLANEFRLRHPNEYKDYLNGKRSEPVTYIQYYRITREYSKLDNNLSKNLRTHSGNVGYTGAIGAPGPGTFEIDATGGRIFLVSSTGVILRRPTIYLIIDRWSRYISSVYISVNPPSFEEVRQALLISFTSRETRFSGLGIDVTDARWPIAQVPSAIFIDRGAEFMSASFENSVVTELHVELRVLPPLTPDGKAIIERAIGSLKRRMPDSGLKGVYANRQLDPETKKAAKLAKAAAVHSLAQAYRKLVELIIDHNNRPHKTLKKIAALSLANVPPTPQAAYLWGLKNITGVRAAKFSDEQYRRIFLSFDKANLSQGTLNYKGRVYMPSNEAAESLISKSPKRTHEVDIRLDKNCPYDVAVASPRGKWATFQIVPGARQELEGTSIDELAVFSAQAALSWAEADSNSRRERVAKKSMKPVSPKPTETIISASRQEQNDASVRESTKMKLNMAGAAMTSIPEAAKLEPNKKQLIKDWREIERDDLERLAMEAKKDWNKK